MAETPAPFINIYSPADWHGEAWIAGNRAGLVRLRLAIEEAIEWADAGDEPNSACGAFATDGEGYDAFVVLIEDRGKLGALRDHYRSAPGSNTEGAHPSDFLTTERIRYLAEWNRARG